MSLYPPSVARRVPVIELRRPSASLPGATTRDLLLAALAAEDRGEPAESGLSEARPGAASDGRDLSPEQALARLHRQRRAGLEETLLGLYYGNFSLFRAESAARTLCGEALNGATISACIDAITPRLENWLKRPITPRYDFVFLDTIVVRQRLKHGPQETSLHYAVGIDAQGAREVLGVHGASDTGEGGWTTFLRELRRRGLKEVRLFVGGIEEPFIKAVGREFPAVRLQVCVAQLEREVLARVPGSGLHAATLACAALHPAPESEMSGEKIRQMLERLDRNELAEACSLLRRLVPMAFSYRPFPRSQWSQLSSTEGFRRAVKPFRQRIRLVGPIEDTRALTLLAAAHLRQVARTSWDRRRYLRVR